MVDIYEGGYQTEKVIISGKRKRAERVMRQGRYQILKISLESFNGLRSNGLHANLPNEAGNSMW